MKLLKNIGLVLLIIISLIMAALLFIREQIPEGNTGVRAEKLTTELNQAVNKAAWDNIQWISWSYKGKRDYIWNKAEHLAVIQFGKYRVHLNLISKKGSVWINGKAVENTKKEKLIKRAWSFWCHDSNWLNPVVKIQDEGTVRKAVDMQDGKKGLLVTYTGGGTMPGNTYLFVMEENGLPEYWKMWTRRIPIGGIRATFENYQILDRGAKIALNHRIGPFDVSIQELKVGNSYQEIGMRRDPFLFIEE